MADSKISALTDGGNLQGTDQVAINRGGTSYRAVALQDGWIDDTAETWTYVSGSGGGTASFKITGTDVSAKYTVGTRIKLTQTTVKYFVVIAVAFSTDTTVTITAGSDYTLANAAISVNYHSYGANPQGYPGWFNFAAAVTGWAATPTVVSRFSIVGRICAIEITITGTSNATTATATLPATSGASAPTMRIPAGQITDNGSAKTVVGRGVLNASATTLTFGLDLVTTGGFTATGTKAISIGFIYEI